MYMIYAISKDLFKYILLVTMADMLFGGIMLVQYKEA